MAKIIFVGNSELLPLFRLAGIDFLRKEELKEEDFQRLKEYEVILCEEKFYPQLFQKIKDRYVVKFYDLDSNKNLIKSEITRLIRQTVGESAL